jgi:predicted nucleic acid-binding protein
MVDLQPNDWARVNSLLRTYADLRLGVIDASVMAVAESLSATQIATLDHRHFTVVRPSHLPAFELLP